MKPLPPFLILAVFGLLVLGGCSTDNPVGSSSLASDATAGSSNEDGDQPDGQPPHDPMRGRVGLPGPLVQEEIPEGGTYDSVTGWFVVPPENDEHGATINRSYAFYDADGAAQSAYDKGLTASIALRFALEAHPSFDGQAGTIRIEHDLTVGGLNGAEASRIWNGSMQKHTKGVPPPRGPGGADGPRRPGGGGPPNGPDDRPDPSGLEMTETSTIEDVTVPYPLGEETWPLSGTITRATRIEGGPNGTEERTGILTFNGTRYATLTIEGETKQIDLKNPRPPRPPRQ